MVDQLKVRCDHLREEIENLSLHLDEREEGMEITLHEFMGAIGERFEEMEKKIQMINRKKN
jgi:hypothetical protein